MQLCTKHMVQWITTRLPSSVQCNNTVRKHQTHPNPFICLDPPHRRRMLFIQVVFTPSMEVDLTYFFHRSRSHFTSDASVNADADAWWKVQSKPMYSFEASTLTIGVNTPYQWPVAYPGRRGGGANPSVWGKNHYYRPQTKFAKAMFSQVSVCTRGGGVSVSVRGVSVSVLGGVSVRGGLCLGGVCLEGVSVQGGLSRRPPMVMSGQYASYWNAFLFDKTFAKNCMKRKEIGLGWGWLGGVWYGAANAYRRADKRTILIAIRQQLPIRRQSSHNAINHCV